MMTMHVSRSELSARQPHCTLIRQGQSALMKEEYGIGHTTIELED